MKALNYITLIFIGAYLLFASYITGYKVCEVDRASEATPSDYVEFCDYQSSYRLHKDTQYRVERITDITGTYYFVYLWHGNNHLVVEYSDTVIDGQFTFSKHWADSFVMNFKGDK